MSQILPPDMIPVTSSNVKAYGYREADETLFVAFLGKGKKPDTLYRYKNFPPKKWLEFKAAASKGVWHSLHVHDNPAYPYERIG